MIMRFNVSATEPQPSAAEEADARLQGLRRTLGANAGETLPLKVILAMAEDALRQMDDDTDLNKIERSLQGIRHIASKYGTVLQ